MQINLPIDIAGNAVTFSGFSATLQAELSGTGPVLVSGPLALLNSHSYSGIMAVQSELALYEADLSQATVIVQGYLVGRGVVGSVDWSAGGWIAPQLGRLDTADLTASGSGSLEVWIDDVVPGISHGQLRVAGSVDLGTEKNLQAHFYSFDPVVGQELVLIDNDGNDPISGAFSSLPEGSIITHNGAELQVSYAGGDGNDLTLTCVSAPRVWNGSVSALWSEPGNWTPSGVPAAGDFLRFPFGAATLVTINDLPEGTVFSHIEVTGSYILSGNGVELTGSLSGTFGTHVQLPINVAAHAVTISGLSTRLTGEISGSGPVLMSGYLELSSTHSYSGLMTVEYLLELDDADLSQASLVVQGYLSGSGMVGPVAWANNAEIRLESGLINTGNLTAVGSGSLSIGIDGAIPGVNHGQLGVTGSVDLGAGKTLNLSLSSFLVPMVGQTFVLIDNDGVDPINGVFTNLPEGSIIPHNGAELQVSYAGGDGNDFTLTFQTVGDFHTLTYTAGPNGSLLGESSQQVFEGNDGSEITAVPDIGYRFVQWSDASIANPRTETNVTDDLSVEAQFGVDPDVVDLEVAKDNGLQAALDGQELVYAITVANAGLVAANGAQLSDVLPAELVEGEWACIPAESNTACPAPPFDAGTGDLYAEIDLPVGSYLRYDLSARIQAGGGAMVSNTASVTPPAGLDDLAPGNNSATDSTLIEPVGIFSAGFEASPVPLTVPAAAKAQREASGR